MTIPSPADLNALDLIRLAENWEKYLEPFLEKYIFKMYDSELPNFHREMTEEEGVWATEVKWTAKMLRQMLEDLSYSDIVDLWTAKTRGGGGRLAARLYDKAHYYLMTFGISKMDVFRKIVLAELIRTGRIKTNADGTPDVDEEQKALKRYLEAMRRRDYPGSQQ